MLDLLLSLLLCSYCEQTNKFKLIILALYMQRMLKCETPLTPVEDKTVCLTLPLKSVVLKGA